jgi:enamine deaminase RidA (YjgF/YER057c/UK114 family)
MPQINPESWPRPRGYSNGVAARGTYLAIAGQIGWNERNELVGSDIAGQTAQALRNIVAILAAAHANAGHIVRLTWYVTDKHAYMAAEKEIGAAYREIVGDHYPAMTLVQVADLLEDGALVEIEATAVIP